MALLIVTITAKVNSKDFRCITIVNQDGIELMMYEVVGERYNHLPH